MICNELINSRQRIPQRGGSTDLYRYYNLPLEQKLLLIGWFENARKRIESGADNCFEAFIFAWIAFNGWAACVTGIDQDRQMLRALMQCKSVCTEFDKLMASENTDFASRAMQFSQQWPIFEVKSARLVCYEDGSDRRKIVKQYFDQGAEVYSPPCYQRHKIENSELPIDWPHTIDALYSVRCNLFHGAKALSSENDNRIVSCAAYVLIYFLDGSGYLEIQ